VVLAGWLGAFSKDEGPTKQGKLLTIEEVGNEIGSEFFNLK